MEGAGPADAGGCECVADGGPFDTGTFCAVLKWGTAKERRTGRSGIKKLLSVLISLAMAAGSGRGGMVKNRLDHEEGLVKAL